MRIKQSAVILGLLAAFAFGDLFGPTGSANAEVSGLSSIVTQMRLGVHELSGIRRALEKMERNCK